MTSIELATTFLKGKGKVALSEKQSQWLMDLRKKEGCLPYTGCLGKVGNDAVFFKEVKRSFSAVGGFVGKKGLGKYFLITNQI